MGIITYLRNYLIAVLSKTIDLELVLNYYSHLQNIPIQIISSRLTGEYIARFSDVTAIRNAISSVTVSVVFDGFMMLFGGWLLYTQSNYMFKYSLILVLIYLLIVFAYRNRISSISNDIMEKNALLHSFIKESVDGNETIKSNNATGRNIEAFRDKFIDLTSRAFRGSLLFSSQESLVVLTEVIGITMLLWYGMNAVLDGALSIGALVTFYLLLAYFIGPAKNLVELQPIIQKAGIALERLNDILDMKSETDTFTGVKNLTRIDEIEFANTKFSYDGENDILKGLSIKISKGDKVALIGKSGCGKSTSVKLLMGLYYSNNDVLINGIPLAEYTISEVRDRIAYISQNSFLFANTILHNITLGASNASENDINKAIEKSGLKQMLNDFPLGLNTMLEEDGRNLSSGQKQRIALARALVRHPDVIILDEATTNLDAETEHSIQNTIMELNDVICIIISHKNTVISECECVYFINDGSVALQGSYEEISRSHIFQKTYFS